MTAAALNFGSLNDALANADPYKNAMGWLESEDEFRKQHPDVVTDLHKSEKTGRVNLLRSAGPISDRYILGANPLDLIIGPGGSGKTIASGKKALVEAQRMLPGPDGVRRYVLGTWRQKYVNVWKATIPSWWKLFPRDLPGSRWTGASPREAEHTVQFEDEFGLIAMINRFRAFGESADPDDVLGNEFTDCYLNEWPTLAEDLMIALVDRVGREPPFDIMRRAGRIFGDGNAPDVLSYTYRDWYETPKPGYVLYRQPSGLAPDAENIIPNGGMSRSYYENSAMVNAHRPWWINRMVHARPGFTRANDPVWPTFDDDRNIAKHTIPVIKDLPVIIGADGGGTPAVAYMQERPDGQLRVLAEIPLERGGMAELSIAMMVLEKVRFEGCEFVIQGDPSMDDMKDTEEGSMLSRLSGYLGGRKAIPAPTNNPDVRHEAVREKTRLTCEGNQPGLLIDPSCKAIRRGANQTFAFKKRSGTDDRGDVAKTMDSHICEALEYGAMLCGSTLARLRESQTNTERRKRQEASRNTPRRNPLRRSS